MLEVVKQWSKVNILYKCNKVAGWSGALIQGLSYLCFFQKTPWFLSSKCLSYMSYFIERTCAVATEELSAVKRTESDVTSPELKRPLIQFAVVHKTHKHTREKYQQHVTNITATGEYMSCHRDCVILTLLLIRQQWHAING